MLELKTCLNAEDNLLLPNSVDDQRPLMNEALTSSRVNDLMTKYLLDPATFCTVPKYVLNVQRGCDEAEGDGKFIGNSAPSPRHLAPEAEDNSGTPETPEVPETPEKIPVTPDGGSPHDLSPVYPHEPSRVLHDLSPATNDLSPVLATPVSLPQTSKHSKGVLVNESAQIFLGGIISIKSLHGNLTRELTAKNVLEVHQEELEETLEFRKHESE